MKQIIHFMRKKISSERVDLTIASIAGSGCALFVFISTTLKLTRLGLDEKETFFGILLICCLTSHCAVAGFLCEIYKCLREKSKES